jgi:hypothetical protein
MWLKILMVVMVGILTVGVYGQDKKEMEEADSEVKDIVLVDDISRNPQAIILLLGDSGENMKTAEEFLVDSGKGKDLVGDKGIEKKLEKSQKAINKVLVGRKVEIKPAGDIQSSILQLVDMLLLTTKETQNIAIARLEELLRKLPDTKPESRQPSDNENQPEPQNAEPQDPTEPANKPYDVNRVGDSSPIPRHPNESGDWVRLPERVREQILAGERDIEKFPAEYRDILKRYFESLGQK